MSAPEWRLAEAYHDEDRGSEDRRRQELRQKAYALAMAGKLAEAAEGADRALNLLGRRAGKQAERSADASPMRRQARLRTVPVRNRIAYPARPREHRRRRSRGPRMRPSLLNPLFAAVTTLPGIGPNWRSSIAGCSTARQAARVIDLLFHLPTGMIDRRARPKLRDVVPDTVVTVAVTVDRHRPPPPHRPRAPYQVYTSDETGESR